MRGKRRTNSTRLPGHQLLLFSLCSAFACGCATPPAAGPTIAVEPPSPEAQREHYRPDVRESRDDDGNLLRRIEGVVDGENDFIPHGTTTNFWVTGQKKSELTFVYGRTQGSTTAWYQSGQIWSSGEYIDGREHGTWTVWLPNGRMAQQINFDHGAWQGLYTEWHSNGQKKMEVAYVAGQRQGTLTEWEPDGSVRREIEYVDGTEQP